MDNNELDISNEIVEKFTKRLYKMPLTSRAFSSAIYLMTKEILNQPMDESVVICPACGCFRRRNEKCKYCGV